jgi:hypothetical protein
MISHFNKKIKNQKMPNAAYYKLKEGKEAKKTAHNKLPKNNGCIFCGSSLSLKTGTCQVCQVCQVCEANQKK